MRAVRPPFLSRTTQAGAAALLAAALAQCGGSGGVGSDEGGDCSPGTETCPCLADQCFSGLQCLSGLCVAVPDQGSSGQPSGEPETTAPTTGQSGSGGTTAPAADTTDAGDATMPTTGTDPVDTGTGTSTGVGPGTDTDPGTSTSTTTDTSTGAGMTTSEPPLCGDGDVDVGEACDDGNDIDDDACSNTCTSNLPIIVYVDPVKTTMYGETIGEPFDAVCDTVSGGLFGDSDATAVFALGGTCKRPKLVKNGADYTLEFTPTASLPWVGTQNGATTASSCALGSVAIGYTTFVEGWVEGVRTVCATLKLVNGVLVVGQGSNSTKIGGGVIGIGATCPKGSIITGHHGYAGDRVYGLGFHCARPVAILE